MQSIYDISGNVFYSPESIYKGKKLSILGDSISTFSGYIPSGNATFYPRPYCPTVNDTWWKKLIDALGMVLDVNNSWSGSRVTTTAGEESAGCMTRCQNLGTSPDVIIVYMGINDFNGEVSLGTYDGNGTFPTVTTNFREAYAIMIEKIMTAYPHAEIWCATLPSCERNGDLGAPEKNGNNVLLDDFNKAIRNLSQVFCAKVLEHAQCGLTYDNMQIYMGDWTDDTHTALHPNSAGHSLIANNDIWQMDSYVRLRY